MTNCSFLRSSQRRRQVLTPSEWISICLSRYVDNLCVCSFCPVRTGKLERRKQKLVIGSGYREDKERQTDRERERANAGEDERVFDGTESFVRSLSLHPPTDLMDNWRASTSNNVFGLLSIFFDRQREKQKQTWVLVILIGDDYFTPWSICFCRKCQRVNLINCFWCHFHQFLSLSLSLSFSLSSLFTREKMNLGVISQYRRPFNHSYTCPVETGD